MIVVADAVDTLAGVMLVIVGAVTSRTAFACVAYSALVAVTFTSYNPSTRPVGSVQEIDPAAHVGDAHDPLDPIVTDPAEPPKSLPLIANDCPGEVFSFTTGVPVDGDVIDGVVTNVTGMPVVATGPPPAAVTDTSTDALSVPPVGTMHVNDNPSEAGATLPHVNVPVAPSLNVTTAGLDPDAGTKFVPVTVIVVPPLVDTYAGDELAFIPLTPVTVGAPAYVYVYVPAGFNDPPFVDTTTSTAPAACAARVHVTLVAVAAAVNGHATPSTVTDVPAYGEVAAE